AGLPSCVSGGTPPRRPDWSPHQATHRPVPQQVVRWLPRQAPAASAPTPTCQSRPATPPTVAECALQAISWNHPFCCTDGSMQHQGNPNVKPLSRNKELKRKRILEDQCCVIVVSAGDALIDDLRHRQAELVGDGVAEIQMGIVAGIVFIITEADLGRKFLVPP